MQLKKIGIVIDRFEPTYKNKIGFKISINGEEIIIIENKNEDNINILKDDKIVLKEDEKKEYRLEKYE